MFRTTMLMLRSLAMTMAIVLMTDSPSAELHNFLPAGRFNFCNDVSGQPMGCANFLFYSLHFHWLLLEILIG